MDDDYDHAAGNEHHRKFTSTLKAMNVFEMIVLLRDLLGYLYIFLFPVNYVATLLEPGALILSEVDGSDYSSAGEQREVRVNILGDM